MDGIVSPISVRWGWVGSAYLKFSPAVITAVTLSACLTSHLAAPTAHGGSEKSHSMFGATTINMRLIEFTTLASGAAALAARPCEALAG